MIDPCLRTPSRTPSHEETGYGGGEQLLLALEVVVETATRQLRLFHDHVDRDAVEAVTIEENACALDNLGARAFLVSGAIGHDDLTI